MLDQQHCRVDEKNMSYTITVPELSDKEYLTRLADEFDEMAMWSSGDEDKPEGTHTITISVTMAQQIAARLRLVAGKMA